MTPTMVDHSNFFRGRGGGRAVGYYFFEGRGELLAVWLKD